MKYPKVAQIVDALGGADNIGAVEPCVTRLRFEVHDATAVDQSRLRPPLCYGATILGSAVQVIVGPEAEVMMDDLVELL
ncbi:MAG: PTS transporter subunit EIIB [Actinomycetaceae bacterium]|nr:PTS transporter subunit EIIB [Actinomycetaceae bacterium]